MNVLTDVDQILSAWERGRNS